ncbi:hypothetical protein C1I98_09360 [Spongiactinospora gelatinilytica]|uniref:Uncharacterized protein n=1 Tax=Spongiactinospora gelatinilytica TaxID=2666298 RepID=A0A2W2GSU5_9ACTN|nr:hypothetical protein [Spongiactinospora gelatinilytica]PZG51012.1 hypothetical protein C1I98_09360 [Spongiactinospora gelatinilytica]
MIRRLFYLSLGALAAVWVMRRLRALQPDHIAHRAAGRVTGAMAGLRDFAGDAMEAAAKREIELRAEYGLDTGIDPTLPANHYLKDGR